MKYLRKTLLLLPLLFFIGCGPSQHQMFLNTSKKYNINHKTLKAICKKESNLQPYVVNVNKSIFDIQRGGHYFSNWFTANLYMDTILDPLGLNYDIGLCQINKIHLDRYNLDNEDLLDEEINIDIAGKIYNWNVKACKGDIICALSLYNTGHKNSKIGKRYAKKVLKIRKEMFGK